MSSTQDIETRRWHPCFWQQRCRLEFLFWNPVEFRRSTNTDTAQFQCHIQPQSWVYMVLLPIITLPSYRGLQINSYYMLLIIAWKSIFCYYTNTLSCCLCLALRRFEGIFWKIGNVSSISWYSNLKGLSLPATYGFYWEKKNSEHRFVLPVVKSSTALWL